MEEIEGRCWESCCSTMREMRRAAHGMLAVCVREMCRAHSMLAQQCLHLDWRYISVTKKCVWYIDKHQTVDHEILLFHNINNSKKHYNKVPAENQKHQNPKKIMQHVDVTHEIVQSLCLQWKNPCPKFLLPPQNSFKRLISRHMFIYNMPNQLTYIQLHVKKTFLLKSKYLPRLQSSTYI